MKRETGKVELLSPAGDFMTAIAAFDAGADAVYCGLDNHSARAFAANFSVRELRELIRVAHSRGKKVYVAFNTVIDECDMENAIDELASLADARPDALIVQDLGVARICRNHFPELELHASTQLVAHNLEGVMALGRLGFSRVVLSRELSLEEIAAIAKRCGNIELECFIHGALCYSISGLCLFSAIEKGRSGNRGRCAYCCRQQYANEKGEKTLPFSMRDLRLGAEAAKLVECGVSSLKIEGRMKNELYVASVTKYYRDILDRAPKRSVSESDLETVFSRRTTQLYFNGRAGCEAQAVDGESLGHIGTEIGTVKRVTKDREGRAWLRFHTLRALERHDGLQFRIEEGDKPAGFGISDMRKAISRVNVFETPAGSDVEILLPDDRTDDKCNVDFAKALKPGMKDYCSMSNAVKRMFPAPSYRPGDYKGDLKTDLKVDISEGKLSVAGKCGELEAYVEASGPFDEAKNPGKTAEAIAKAFGKTGESDYLPGEIELADESRRFVPMAVWNEVRRELYGKLDVMRMERIRKRAESAKSEDASGNSGNAEIKTLKVNFGDNIPEGEWDEVIVAITKDDTMDNQWYSSLKERMGDKIRLATGVYTSEPDYQKLRRTIKNFIRGGVVKWEASDLATLSTLKECGIEDITADWTLYAFNAQALKLLSELGVRRFVASPENSRDNLQFLAESGYDVEFLAQQSTPLFISLNKPAETLGGEAPVRVYRRNGLYVTVKPNPRIYEAPKGHSCRYDLSWNLPQT